MIFGPSKLPQLGRSLGQGLREFKKATQSITEEVTKAAMEETPLVEKPRPAADEKPAAVSEQKADPGP